MADGDDGVDEGQFLTGDEDVSGLGFPLASGIDVRRVGEAIVGSIALSVGIGVNTVIGGAADAYAGLIDGLTDFIAGAERVVRRRGGIGYDVVEEPGLIDVTIGAAAAGLEGAWQFSLSEFGLLALPVAIGVLLVTAYAAQRGIEAGREVLR